MKKLLAIYALLIGAFLLYLFYYQMHDSKENPWDNQGLRGEIGEKYVMVTFQAGIDYWKSCLKGFEDAAQALNVSVEFRGSTQYDAHEEMTVLEQVIAKKPAGIALSAINPQMLNATIDKAVDAGIPVVLFDSGAPASKAYSFLGTDNFNAGATAARKMAELLDNKGEVAVITSVNQLNHQERTKGFQDTIVRSFPNMRVVAIKDGKGDRVASREAAQEIMAKHPNLAGIFVTEANGGVGVGEAARYDGKDKKMKIISFDTDKGTLDMVREGTISATLAQGTWNMGYWSLLFLFHLAHGMVQPTNKQTANPLPLYVDTGITVVTEENVDYYYAR
ncbi:MAG TPA: substrate-binding domain-containing protein [Bacilli bacterium]